MGKCGLLGCNEIENSLNPGSPSWHRKGANACNYYCLQQPVSLDSDKNLFWPWFTYFSDHKYYKFPSKYCRNQQIVLSTSWFNVHAGR